MVKGFDQVISEILWALSFCDLNNDYLPAGSLTDISPAPT